VTPLPRLVYCHCAYAQVVPAEVKAEVLRGLAASSEPFEAVPDLCEMSARRDPRLLEIASAGDTVMIACYPRAIRWLFNAAGAPLPDTGIRVMNMRIHNAERILTAVAERTELDGSQADATVEQP
jgi:hypothetical protein